MHQIRDVLQRSSRQNIRCLVRRRKEYSRQYTVCEPKCKPTCKGNQSHYSVERILIAKKALTILDLHIFSSIYSQRIDLVQMARVKTRLF